jgi:hypothetical protein
VVSLLTTEVHNRALAAYLSEQTRASANSGYRIRGYRSCLELGGSGCDSGR